jgi:hypothetical protein
MPHRWRDGWEEALYEDSCEDCFFESELPAFQF